MASQYSQSIDNSKLPLATPPPGVIPNLIHPASRAYQIYAVSSVFLTLMVFFVAIRLYAKWVLQKRRTWDDYVCLAGMGVIISYVALRIDEVKYVYGRHLWELSIGDLSNQLQMENTFAIAFYDIAILLVKLTILMLLNQIFGLLHWMRICFRIGVIACTVWYLSGFIITFCLCGPSGGLDWLQVSQTARCLEIRNYGIGRSVFNIMSDFYLLIIPIPAVWSLQMPTRRKIGVWAVFMTGGFTCIVTCVGLWLRILELRQGPSYDLTWKIVTVWITAIVEMTVGLSVACMPNLPTVVRHHGFPWTTFWTFLASKISAFSTKISNQSKALMNRIPSNGSLLYGDESSGGPRGEGIAMRRRAYAEPDYGLKRTVRPGEV